MDLIHILRNRILALVPGDYTPGLQSVLQHVQVAANHLARGTSTRDETAFTDTIYRTNQAFEGSLKEAFRVLAEKDPEKAKPFNIENFFQEQQILRKRVISQLTTYRTEWRNPSTHDYKLDFDEDEALLAIVTVCAFAIMLIDQISEKLSFDKAKAETLPASPVVDPSKSLTDLVADSLIGFRLSHPRINSSELPRESEIVGALAGHLTAALPGLVVNTDASIGPGGRARPDLLLKLGDAKLILEVKVSRHRMEMRSMGIEQVAHYIAISGINEAILYIHSHESDADMIRDDQPLQGGAIRIAVIRPRRVGNTA